MAKPHTIHVVQMASANPPHHPTQGPRPAGLAASAVDHSTHATHTSSGLLLPPLPSSPSLQPAGSAAVRAPAAPATRGRASCLPPPASPGGPPALSASAASTCAAQTHASIVTASAACTLNPALHDPAVQRSFCSSAPTLRTCAWVQSRIGSSATVPSATKAYSGEPMPQPLRNLQGARNFKLPQHTGSAPQCFNKRQAGRGSDALSRCEGITRPAATALWAVCAKCHDNLSDLLSAASTNLSAAFHSSSRPPPSHSCVACCQS